MDLMPKRNAVVIFSELNENPPGRFSTMVKYRFYFHLDKFRNFSLIQDQGK